MLLPRVSGSGRALCCEVMVVTPAIRNLIRESKIEQITIAMQTGGKYGMQTMNTALADLYLKRQINYQEAISRTTDQEDLRRLIERQPVK